MRRPKIYVRRARTRGHSEWYWYLRAGNGEVVCNSETFTRKGDAYRAAKRARLLMTFATIREVKE